MDRNTKINCEISKSGVVPRKGDVDRNRFNSRSLMNYDLSSPARGTWIEIRSQSNTTCSKKVVPRKGDVDRNIAVHLVEGDENCRPPQGGRG